MEIYYFTILLFSFLGFLEWTTTETNIKHLFKSIYFLVFCVLVFEIGFRWQTGSDWDAYLQHFLTFSRGGYEVISTEIGYHYFVKFMYNFGDDYTTLLIVHSIIVYSLIFITYKHFSPFFLFSIVIMYSGMMGLVGANRQLLAVGFGMIALVFLVKNKYVWYVFFVLVAMLFHSTAFLLFIFLFLKRRFTTKQIVFFILVCFFVGLTSIPFTFFGFASGFGDQFAGKTEVYYEQARNAGPIGISVIGLLKRLLFFVTFVYNRNLIEKVSVNYNFLLNGYIVGLGFYFIFYLTMPVMISRGSVYFNILEPILLSLQLYLITEPLKKIVFTVLCVFFCILLLHQSISTYPDLFDPYKSIFYNQDYRRIMY